MPPRCVAAPLFILAGNGIGIVAMLTPLVSEAAEPGVPCRRASCMSERFHVEPLSPRERQAMDGRGWRKDCPVGPDRLREVHLAHWTADGTVADGLLIVHADLADDVKDAFAELFDEHFVVARVAPASAFGGDDRALMEANVTSAFNCRRMTNGRAWSLHSDGVAIDINPLWNPYVKGNDIRPALGRAFADRVAVRGLPGVLEAGGAAVRAFERRGFTWGGRWRGLKDWQHVERKNARPSAVR
jgi:hypothetical protein